MTAVAADSSPPLVELDLRPPPERPRQFWSAFGNDLEPPNSQPHRAPMLPSQQSRSSPIVSTRKSHTARSMWPAWNPSRMRLEYWHLPRLHLGHLGASPIHYMPERLM